MTAKYSPCTNYKYFKCDSVGLGKLQYFMFSLVTVNKRCHQTVPLY